MNRKLPNRNRNGIARQKFICPLTTWDRRSISKEKRRFLLRHSDWRSSVLLSFGYDPLFCNSCNSSMMALEVYYKKIALFEQYRKAMRSG